MRIISLLIALFFFTAAFAADNTDANQAQTVNTPQAKANTQKILCAPGGPCSELDEANGSSDAISQAIKVCQQTCGKKANE